MVADIRNLEHRAVEFARQGNFGPDALQVNVELSSAAPANPGVWTRLARCHMEQGQFDEAAGALDKALELNPSNGIAKSLQTEVMRRRAARPVLSPASSGFTPQDFQTLGRLAPSDAMTALGPKFEALLLSLNEQRTVKRIVEARGRVGVGGAKLFHRNSYHSGGNGHIYAYHHGGRWEPQFNIGIFSDHPWQINAFRIGLGFNLSPGGRDLDREAGQEQIATYFEQFQSALQPTWRGHLVEWMGKSSGFIQFSDRGPALDLLPKQAVDWLINCRNPVGVEWIFCGRWLMLDKPDDARTLGEMPRLIVAVEDTFAALFPLWMATCKKA
jgi:tetratricopeptide (TPR) repeat protein